MYVVSLAMLRLLSVSRSAPRGEYMHVHAGAGLAVRAGRHPCPSVANGDVVVALARHLKARILQDDVGDALRLEQPSDHCVGVW